MSQFLLVHGAFHGAWCWRKTVEELESAATARRPSICRARARIKRRSRK